MTIEDCYARVKGQISILKARGNLDEKDSELLEELEISAIAIREQIQAKPILIGDDFSSVLSCPNCHNHISNVWNKAEYKPNYCHYCGQAFDWSEDEI